MGSPSGSESLPRTPGAGTISVVSSGVDPLSATALGAWLMLEIDRLWVPMSVRFPSSAVNPNESEPL